VPRKKREPVDGEVARHLGALLRDLRKAAGYRAVGDAAATPGCPSSQPAIYLYERGDQLPSLQQFLDLVEFYATGGSDAVRHQAVSAVVAALGMPVYDVRRAVDLIARLQPAPRRRARGGRDGGG
jgi:hypothetical protein